MTNTPTVEVPRAWLDRLVDLAEKLGKTNDWQAEATMKERLFGYIESAKALLANK